MNAVCGKDYYRPGMECIVTGTVKWQTRSSAQNATASGLAGFTYILGASRETFHGAFYDPISYRGQAII